ncbi:MAG: hypothetical protein NVSMB62_18220 [Acidobacteriaceae bacterium]
MRQGGVLLTPTESKGENHHSSPTSPQAPGRPPETAAPLRLCYLAFGASLLASTLLAAAFSLHWPLVGDSSLIHYIAFLIERGWAPYRQLGDMNLPGSFLIELAAMHLFGPGALAWRLFDLTLALASAVSFAAIPRPQRSSGTPHAHWLAPLFAASLFFLIHTRDGLAQGGQRDLTMAVALLAATACLLHAVRRNSFAAAALFGLLSGLALTIKPTTILLTAAQLLLVFYANRRIPPDTPTPARLLTPAALSLLIAPALSLVFLLHEHAFRAFLEGLHTVVPYYASLGHRPLAYVLQHSLSPILPLVVLWLLLLALHPQTLSLERRLLLAGVSFGLLHCILQHRALPYYRYPLLAFLLPLIALDVSHHAFTPLARTRGRRLIRPLAFLSLGFGALFLAPQSAILIHRYRWQQTDMLTSLQRDLEALGPAALSHHIQCIDSVSGCNTVLYRMRLEPATGVLSDFLLFGNTTDAAPPEAIPLIRDTRAAFSAALLADPPQVIVVTSHLHMTGPENFGKLARWPAFATFLSTRYTLATEWSPTRTERWWSREELPAAYRIYSLRPAP